MQVAATLAFLLSGDLLGFEHHTLTQAPFCAAPLEALLLVCYPGAQHILGNGMRLLESARAGTLFLHLPFFAVFCVPLPAACQLDIKICLRMVWNDAEFDHVCNSTHVLTPVAFWALASLTIL